MKKVAIMAVCLLTLGACQQKTENKDSKIDGVRDSMAQIISQKDSEINDIMSTFNDIQEGFREINESLGACQLGTCESRKNVTRGHYGQYIIYPSHDAVE